MRTRAIGIISCVAAFFLSAALALPPAHAHAELREASPAAGQTVGGEFHQVSMFFSGLDPSLPQQARLFDPAGNLLREDPTRIDQRLVLSIDPLSVPGEYLVVFEVTGIDGDFTSESFTFLYDPDAPEPEPISLASVNDGFDLINFGLLLVGAAAAAFLVHRFMTAWRDHRAAQQATEALL